MKVKLDENLSRHLKTPLANLGLNVSTALDEGLLHKSDAKVAKTARGEDRIIFTLDLDFSDIRKFAPGTHPGIVIFRPKFMGPVYVERFIMQFVRENDLASFQGCLVIVEQEQIRVRKPDAGAEE